MTIGIDDGNPRLDKPAHWNVSPTQVQEELSYAYVHAVCSQAGCIARRTPPPAYSTDMDITYMSSVCGSQCDVASVKVQLKASYAARVSGNYVKLKMEMSDYSKLTFASKDPKILILFLMPRNVHQWVTTTEDLLAMKKCAYWLDMRSYSPIKNKENVILNIPRANAFNVAAVCGPIRKVVEGWYEK